MPNRILNTLVLVVLTIFLAGAGYYATEVHQPAELKIIENQEIEARLRSARAEALLAEEAESEGQADAVIRRWRSRYKKMPPTMETPDLVQYLERLTSRGFDDISISVSGRQSEPNLSMYNFEIRGVALFRSLYDLVWQLENNRQFYHVHNLSLASVTVQEENRTTGLSRKVDMVRFSMTLRAFFGGSEGLNAPQGDPVEIPDSVLPIRSPAHNSFYPIVRTDKPSNDRQLVDIEEARLVSVIGKKAVFQDAMGLRELREGDEVYRGTIVMIDPSRATVRASLNKGGVIDVVDVKISYEEGQYRAAQGRVRLTPIEDN